MKKSSFEKIINKCKREVKKWSKWKQNIVITSETAMTGNFIKKFRKKDIT